MELMAVIRSLQELKIPCRVKLYSDSKYVVDAFNQNWISGWVEKGWKKSATQMQRHKQAKRQPSSAPPSPSLHSSILALLSL